MRVNIMVGTADLGWIGGRFARELAARLPQFGVEATINGDRADVEYDQIVYGDPTHRPAVGMFTHGADRPQRFGGAYDGCIALNAVMLGYLTAAAANRPTLIEMPVGDAFIPRWPIVFGVCGSTKADGRKGEHLVRAMMIAGYCVRAWGHGWPCEIVSNRVEDLPNFYKSLNYYIDTSSDEGGCVPALEAAALGIPVISHTLGVDRPVIAYERSDWPSLRRVLEGLTRPRTYDAWARETAAFLTRVVEEVA